MLFTEVVEGLGKLNSPLFSERKLKIGLQMGATEPGQGVMVCMARPTWPFIIPDLCSGLSAIKVKINVRYSKRQKSGHRVALLSAFPSVSR